MLNIAIDVLGLFFLFGAAAFIGIVGYIAIKDTPQLKRDPNYMSWFFLHRKNHARLFLALGLLNLTTIAALVTLIGIREGRL